MAATQHHRPRAATSRPKRVGIPRLQRITGRGTVPNNRQKPWVLRSKFQGPTGTAGRAAIRNGMLKVAEVYTKLYGRISQHAIHGPQRPSWRHRAGVRRLGVVGPAVS